MLTVLQDLVVFKWKDDEEEELLSYYFSVSQHFQMYPPQCEHSLTPSQANKEYKLSFTA